MKRYSHEFVLHFTVESDSSCEDVDNYPSEEEYLEALLQRITDLRQGGSISGACELVETKEVKSRNAT